MCVNKSDKKTSQEQRRGEEKHTLEKERERKKNFQLKPHADHVLQALSEILFLSHGGLKATRRFTVQSSRQKLD